MGSSFQPDVPVSESARLNSDQVNYLIWRYLQESGYGEAAVKLQRDWKQDPQSLPLAKNMKSGALIRLIKYGLRYYYTDQTWDRHACRKIPFRSSMLFFGPESARPGVQKEEVGAADGETGAEQQRRSPSDNSVRKHPREYVANGLADQTGQPAPKRSRKAATHHHHDRHQEPQVPPQTLSSSSAAAAAAAAAAAQQQDADGETTTIDDKFAMDLDQQAGTANSAGLALVKPGSEAKPAPPASDPNQDADVDMGVGNGVAQALEQGDGALASASCVMEAQEEERINEALAPIATLDLGSSVGVQFVPAKSPDLDLRLLESTVLQVADDAHVTSASWRPTNPRVLAISGQDFVGMWKVADHSSPSGPLVAPLQNIIDRRDETMVSAMAWEPGGTVLAVAVFDHHTAGTIRIYDGQEAVLIESLPAAQRLITTLRWQEVGSRLMGFAASATESSLAVWDLSGSASLQGAFTVTVPMQINDIDWAHHGNLSTVCAAGDGTVYQFRTAPELAVENQWRSASEDNANWTLVRCSWWSEEALVVITASAHPATIWIPTRDIYVRNVHNTPLTCLELRPAPTIYPEQGLCCDFATSSVEGTVKLWRYSERTASIECLVKLCMADSPPILALSYTPDGSAIAAASYDKVTLWNAEKRGPPLGKWEGNESSWAGANLRRQRRVSQGETMSEDGVREDAEHSLSWDAESRNLAFALGNQVAIINFKR